MIETTEDKNSSISIDMWILKNWIRMQHVFFAFRARKTNMKEREPSLITLRSFNDIDVPWLMVEKCKQITPSPAERQLLKEGKRRKNMKTEYLTDGKPA